MNYVIIDIPKSAVAQLDNIFKDINDTWREPTLGVSELCPEMCCIDLNDAWISVINENVYICCDGTEILLYRGMFHSIVIS